jgi:Calcineurin-like phosphoesterase
VRWLLERVPDRPTIYIAGNHEPFGQDIDRDLEKARAAAAGTNVFVMENDTVTIGGIGGITFIGCCLWTDFDLFGDVGHAMAAAGETMNDYRKIRFRNYERRLRPQNTLQRHMESRDFIARELRQPGRRHVVVTHHGAHPNAARRGFERDISSAAYTSDLSALIQECGPELWLYGHTHESRDFMVGATRMITNSKGYGPWLPRETTWDNPDFNPTYVIEI